MNVLEAIGEMTKIMEAMQEHRIGQGERIESLEKGIVAHEKRIKLLEKRVAIHDGIGLFVVLVVLLAAFFLS